MAVLLLAALLLVSSYGKKTCPNSRLLSHMNLLTEYLKDTNPQEANHLFFPEDPASWCRNAALQFFDAASNRIEFTRSLETWDPVIGQEVLQSIEIAWLLSPFDDGCASELDFLLEWEVCHQPREDPYSVAVKLLRSGNTLDAIDSLCSDPRNIVMHLDSSVETVYRSLVAFKICGAVKFNSLYDTDTIDNLATRLEPIVETYLKGVSDDPDNNECTANSHENSLGRYEVLVPFVDPFISPSTIARDDVLYFLQTVLKSNRVDLDIYSYITSLPGCEMQGFHRDTSIPFDAHLNGDSRKLPPYGVVMVLPVEDVPLEKGPTDLSLGTHLLLELHEEKYLTHTTSKKGDVSFFDLRLSHRGTENTSNEKRSILYISYVQDWWFDRVNWREPQSIDFDKLDDPRLRRLLTRLDTKNYIQKLEERVIELGGDLIDISSQKYANTCDNSDVSDEVI